MALSRGLRLHQYPDDWLIRSQSQEEARVNTQAVVDLTESLGWIINQEKSELKPAQVFSCVGYEYHPDSALVKPTQERWLKLQDLILRLKTCLDCKIFGERCRPSSQRPQYPALYRCLKRRLGRSLRSKFYKGSVVRPRKKATHKRSRIEGGLPGPSKIQGPVSEPNIANCNRQLNSGSLHKQTRRNSLRRDVCSPV